MTPQPETRRLRTEAGPLAACLIFGVVLSTLPHWLVWPEVGRPHWFRDRDELCYLAIASQAYVHHPWRLADPAVPTDEGGTSPYRALPSLPGIVIARAFGLEPMDIGLAWRLWSGVVMALGYYALLRFFVRSRWVASALVVFILADAGVYTTRPVVQSALLAANVLEGGDLPSQVRIHAGFRIATPALTMPFLLLHITLTIAARAKPTRGRLIAAGLGYGLLFHVYFYYWVSATLALAIAWALDAGHRRIYLVTGILGGLVGLPAVASDVLTKVGTSPDWLQRTDKFLPIGRFDELLIPWSQYLILPVAMALAWRFRRDALYLGALSAAGLLMLNHQVVTGLQIENYHFSGYVGFPCLTLLLIVLTVELATRRGDLVRRAAPWLVGAWLVHAATGLALRAAEIDASRETRQMLDTYKGYRAQRLGPDAPRMVPDSVLAGLDDVQDLAQILEDQRPLFNYIVLISPAVDDADLDRRHALNAYLLGLDRAEFRDEVRDKLEATVWGHWARDPRIRDAKQANLVGAYDEVAADPGAALRRFRVRYLALPPGQAPPEPIDSDWTLLQPAGAWDLWEYLPARDPKMLESDQARPTPESLYR